ncbi:hypothetical protein N7478_004707 [Penicillium angulare]|uniref:uncharacterized protein n=1 Tax=Penicillium angulare TaxID=116970 RepID=UPI00254006BF|nr:uncharacterized protein N7478_004707 [Penicillium angulare]KAJ5279335.1 hypothetical protein N7478_004707 [Penicillium angulare]
MPTPDVLNQLVYTFFHRIHPAYPVFDRESFLQLYYANRASPLVLQTIALLGFTIGSDDLVRAAGFSDRVTARKTHFLRAKALYDADYETDRMNLVAVLLLFGFWWASPEGQKDTCFWVGCASMLAQSLGMHRSDESTDEMLAEANMVTRDRHVSAAFGRPYRIRDEDCDVEPLTEEDFTFDTAYDLELIPAHEDFNTLYVIEMSKLAVISNSRPKISQFAVVVFADFICIIVGDVLTAEYSPRSNPQSNLQATLQPEALERRLTEWECALPDQLKIKASDNYSGSSFWACMAQFSYQ